MGVMLRGVEKSYGKPVLRSIDLDVPSGQIFALLGPSGCGKTTALRIVAGLETLDAGEVRVDGHRVAGLGLSLPPEARGLGMVFQSYAVWPHMTVLDNVAWPLRLRGMADAPALARRALERVRLGGLEDRWPGTLSGGQQQRVAIARALATRPKVLLLDEPFSNLDVALRQELRDQVSVLVREEGLTVLLVTHDQEEALSMCDRVAVMLDGVVQQVAPPAELYTRPKNTFVAGFVGVLNRLRSRVVDGRTEIGGVEASAAEVDIGFRPESVVFGDTGVACTVERSVYHGAFTRYHLRVGSETIIADARTPATGHFRVTDAWRLEDG
jgi:ABC-type Fe3+/spermidine/putrescine transport system ATPase subunit